MRQRPSACSLLATVHEGQQIQPSEESYISEVASYGAFVADASGSVLTNVHAGFGVRTRPADPSHPLAPSIGFGALSCALAVEGGEAEDEAEGGHRTGPLVQRTAAR